MNRGREKILLILAVGVIIIAAGLALYSFLSGSGERFVDEGAKSPREIMYSLNYLGEMTYDKEKLNGYVRRENKYASFAVKKEYTLIYQLKSGEEYRALAEQIDLEGDVFGFDYERNYLLVSFGRRIEDFERNYSKTVVDGKLLVEPVYSFEYYDSKAFAYSMNKTDFLSGDELEDYYWENNLEGSNLLELSADNGNVLFSGEHHRVIDVGGGVVVCELKNASGKTAFRLDLEDFVSSEELNPQMIRVTWKDRTVFYNSENGKLSSEYDFPTHFFMRRIFYYVRNYHNSGELQLILRDAYDQTAYAKIIYDYELGFSKDVDDIDKLVKNVEYVDNTHVRVTFIGADNTEQSKVIEVYDLNR